MLKLFSIFIFLFYFVISGLKIICHGNADLYYALSETSLWVRHVLSKQSHGVKALLRAQCHLRYGDLSSVISNSRMWYCDVTDYVTVW
jgi:hypothetical protein